MARLDEDDSLAARAVGNDERMMRILRKKDYLARTMWRHGRDEWVGRVEHGKAIGRDILNHDLLDPRDFFGRMNMVQPKVIAFADVGYDGDLAAIKSQAFAQYTAACGFQHSGLHMRMAEHVTRAFWSAAVAAVDLPPTDINTIGVGHPHAQASAR